MATPTVPPNALAGLLAPVASSDAALALAGTAGALQPNTAAATPLAQCLVSLAAALTGAGTYTTADANTAKQILSVMESPFDNLATAIAALLIPNPSTVSSAGSNGSTLSNALQAATAQVQAALTNPFESVMQQQGAAVTSSFDQISKILFTGSGQQNGFFVDYFNQAKTAVKTLFLDPTNNDNNILSIFVYAFEYGIPSIDAELAYLASMRASLAGMTEQASFIPPNMDLNLPNNSVIALLCDAEVNLQEVSDLLRDNAIFDRTRFSKATNDVCSAQSLMQNGKYDISTFLGFSGISGFKAKDLANLSFLPNIMFKLRLQELQTLAFLYEQQEAVVTTLYNNIFSAEETIENLLDYNSGDIIALLVDVIHRQISALRIELQTQGGGSGNGSIPLPAQQTVITSSGQTPAQQNAAVAAQFPGYSPYTPPASQQNTDISTYLSTQAATYLMLVVLCQLMERSQSIYGSIQQLINFETNSMRAIQSILAKFEIANCGPPITGQNVTAALNNLFTVVNARLNTTQSTCTNVQLTAATTNLRQAITAREQFLNCMKNDMTFGLSTLSNALSLVADGTALLNNIKQLVQQFPDLQSTIQSLSLSQLFGTDQQEYSALQNLIQAIQCLLLNCDNPLVQSVGEEAISVFGDQFGLDQSKALTMASLDQVPLVATNARLQNRANQVASVLDAISNLLNLDLSVLCQIAGVPAGQAALNAQRQSAPGAAFGTTPSGPVAPQSTGVSTPSPSQAVQNLQTAIVVNSPFYSAPASANPPAFANSNGSSFVPDGD